jgi:O-antigen/teichoic acid export membrane protein
MPQFVCVASGRTFIMLGQFFKHTSNYTLGSMLMVFAGLVSFPILTRVLSVAEYGLMSLVAVALTLLVALGKMGMQHATLRFYSEIHAGKREVSAQVFTSTAVLGTTAAGLAVTLLWAGVSQLLPQSWWGDARVRPLMLLTSVLVLVRVFESALVNQLRAQERSGSLMVYSVLRRYGQLGVLLAVLLYVAGTVWGFYVATIAGELLSAALLAVWMLRREPIQVRLFSPQLFKVMLAFGLPMIGFELSGVVLSMGDRYIIQKLLGVQELGVYSAAVNLCEVIKGVLFASMIAAAQPMYMRLWEREGSAQTAAFVQRFLTVYVLVSFLVIAQMAAVGGELLGFLASQKYRPGEVVLPWAIAGMAVESVIVITAAGLYIQKRSKTIMLLVLLSAALNLALNFALIPQLGLVGSAVGTLVSCVLLMLVGAFMGRATLPLVLPWLPMLKFGASALVMAGVMLQIHLSHGLLTAVVRSAVGALIYTALVLLLDRQTRLDAGGLWTKVRAKIRPVAKAGESRT